MISINLTHHASQVPVLCQKLAFLVGYEGQCQMSLTHDSAKKPEIILKTGHFTVECQTFHSVIHWPFVSKCQTGSVTVRGVLNYEMVRYLIFTAIYIKDESSHRFLLETEIWDLVPNFCDNQSHLQLYVDLNINKR
jgi:hypothetical protein